MSGRQLQDIASASRAMAEETTRILPDVRKIAVRARLPLVDLALPALRRLSQEQFRQLRLLLQRLIDADSNVDLFEYMLKKVVARHLEPHFPTPAADGPPPRLEGMRPRIEDCSVLLSAVAFAGQEDRAQARAAFAEGSPVLSGFVHAEIPFVSEADASLPRVDEALDHLANAVPRVKGGVLDACVRIVATDGMVREDEAELLRAIADTLDCPIPPFLRPEEPAVSPGV